MSLIESIQITVHNSDERLAAEVIADRIDELAVDFLFWYKDKTEEFDLLEPFEHWEQFKIERNL